MRIFTAQRKGDSNSTQSSKDKNYEKLKNYAWARKYQVHEKMKWNILLHVEECGFFSPVE